MRVRLLAALAGVLAALAVPTTAAAAGVTPGAFCAESQAGQVRAADDGDLYQCRRSGERYRWRPFIALPPTASPTVNPTGNPDPDPNEPTGSPTATYRPTGSPAPSTTAGSPRPRPTGSPASSSAAPGVGAPADGGGAQLPVTGSPTWAIVLAGVVPLLTGAAALWLVRRSRRRFAA